MSIFSRLTSTFSNIGFQSSKSSETEIEVEHKGGNKFVIKGGEFGDQGKEVYINKINGENWESATPDAEKIDEVAKFLKKALSNKKAFAKDVAKPSFRKAELVKTTQKASILKSSQTTEVVKAKVFTSDRINVRKHVPYTITARKSAEVSQESLANSANLSHSQRVPEDGIPLLGEDDQFPQLRNLQIGASPKGDNEEDSEIEIDPLEDPLEFLTEVDMANGEGGQVSERRSSSSAQGWEDDYDVEVEVSPPSLPVIPNEPDVEYDYENDKDIDSNTLLAFEQFIKEVNADKTKTQLEKDQIIVNLYIKESLQGKLGIRGQIDKRERRILENALQNNEVWFQRLKMDPSPSIKELKMFKTEYTFALTECLNRSKEFMTEVEYDLSNIEGSLRKGEKLPEYLQKLKARLGEKAGIDKSRTKANKGLHYAGRAVRPLSILYGGVSNFFRGAKNWVVRGARSVANCASKKFSKIAHDGRVLRAKHSSEYGEKFFEKRNVSIFENNDAANNELIRMRLIAADLELHKVEEVSEERAELTDPNSGMDLVREALENEAEGNYRTAEEQFFKAAIISQNLLRGRPEFELGRMYMQAGQEEIALQWFERGASQGSDLAKLEAARFILAHESPDSIRHMEARAVLLQLSETSTGEIRKEANYILYPKLREQESKEAEQKEGLISQAWQASADENRKIIESLQLVPDQWMEINFKRDQLHKEDADKFLKKCEFALKAVFQPGTEVTRAEWRPVYERMRELGWIGSEFGLQLDNALGITEKERAQLYVQRLKKLKE